ncbi:hypothetical protein ACHAW5_010993 [Stephanodiscus triporus]|uniref:Sulfotransferase domain-containing protein n=1 Tax=Stephanodiscus triporus TaxID=2934178 RepID=A0ABD3NBN0_9STRA
MNQTRVKFDVMPPLPAAAIAAALIVLFLPIRPAIGAGHVAVMPDDEARAGRAAHGDVGDAPPVVAVARERRPPPPSHGSFVEVGDESPTAKNVAVRRIEDRGGGASFDPGSYAYLIVHYHKTGHHLSRQLRDFLVDGTDGDYPVSDGMENAFERRMHEEDTGCPRSVVLSPGVISVQAAPDFFCDAAVLVEHLLRQDEQDDDDGRGTNARARREKLGIKVVHLVRDPFSLAVSNWIYHAQYPTPELWVKDVDPCTEELWFGTQGYRDLVRPTLLSGDDPIMRYDDFDAIRGICVGLYRTRKEAREDKRPWSYYTHLRHLDPESALSMATTHMMGQGMTGGDIVRMANNVVKLRQAMQLEDQIRLSRHVVPDAKGRMIQVMTLSMEEFTREPRAATIRFLDFALGDSSPRDVKERIAAEYESSYRAKVREGNEHITNDKEITNGKYGGDVNIVEKREDLEGFLRHHDLFGRVLGNIERLINDALLESRRNFS